MTRCARMSCGSLPSLALLSCAAIFLVPAALESQADTAARPEADPADVESPASNAERAFDRLRSLFLSGARLVPTGRRPDGEAVHRSFSLEAFLAQARDSYEDRPFYEREVHAVTERYGDIAHVFSTYASRRSPDGEPFTGGINSFQLWYDGDRWWIVHMIWHAQRDGDPPIPERYDGGS